MAYYSRSHYGLTTEEPFPALYGGYILASDGSAATDTPVKATDKVFIEAPFGVWGASVYGGASYGVSALKATEAPALAVGKLLADGAVAADAIAKAYAAAIADGATVADMVAKHFYKVEWEAPAALYGLGVYGFSTYSGAGELLAADALAKTVTKPLTDGVSAAEAIAKHFMTAFSDGASAADAVLKAIDKAIADGVEIDDSDVDVLMLMILTLMQRTTTLHVQERP